MSDITIYSIGKVTYHMISSVEVIDGTPVCMYGIKGVLNDETVSLTGLSDDSSRISKLIDNMNLSGIELCQFRDVVEDFLFENYGMILF